MKGTKDKMVNISLEDEPNGGLTDKRSEKKYIFDDELAARVIEPDDKKDDKSEEEKIPPVSYFSLFKYSTFSDKILIGTGNLAALISGATNPTIIILLGWLLDSLVDHQQKLSGFQCGAENDTSPVTPTFNSSTELPDFSTTPFNDLTDEYMSDFRKKCEIFSLGMAGIALCQYFLSFIIVYTLSRASENQALKIRQNFMRAILRQNIGWFDTHETGDFASRITADLVKIQDGIGDKLGICHYFYSTCFICLGAALYYGWQLTLVILSIMPVLIISSSLIAKVQAKISGDELSAYAKAGSVAEEVLSSIRTVVSFSGEQKEISRYDKELVYAKKNGVKRGLLTSIGLAIVWFCIYASYALAFWYGAKLVLETRCEEGGYNPGTLVIVFFCVLTGAMFVGQTAPYMEAFSVARGAASKVFQIISQVPPIDSSSEAGAKPDTLLGEVKIVDAKFRYPARPEVQVLQGLNLEAIPGETVALVGSSGCGKSTVIQLLQRFYDLEEGQVLIDGNDIKDLNIGWLRDRIGVVGQEPVLFATSIYENIRYGYNKASEEDIINAAKHANAHDFISRLPEGYSTQVGERGTQLSGGQKQRIAIARALVRNPKILLLDEATSALDTESESVVQAALDEARKGRTTLVVAHRLTTIRNANKIVAIENGKVKEVGSHDQLMEQKGVYFNLVTAQVTEQKAEEDEEDEDVVVAVEDNRKLKPERHLSITSTLSGGSDAIPNGLHRNSSLYRINSVKKVNQAEPASAVMDDEDLKADPPKKKLISLAAPEWPYILVGSISSLLMGLSIPIYGIIFGDILQALNEETESARSQTNLYSLVFLLMGVASGIAVFLQTFMFSVAGELLTSRLRKMVFTNMIRQEIAWFDLPENGTGALCSRLSSDASHVQGATGSRIATIFQALSTLAASVVIALYFNYKIGLVVLAFVPIVLVATYLESRVTSSHLLDEKAAFEKATRIAIEAIENVRTVASLHQETEFYNRYASELESPHKKSRKKSYMRGFTFGMSQCVPNLAYGVSMYYGSTLVADGEITYGTLFKVLESVILGCMMIGQAVAFAPDYQRAKVSAVKIFKILEKKSAIDAFVDTGLKPTKVTGEVDFQNVRFSYASRANLRVLRGLNFEARQGETVALVGSSGCGKSTCIQLLQRFYDTDDGEVLVDRTAIKSLNINWLRSRMGLVSQEPVLFGYSIAENIAYGDNSREVPMDEIIEAAKKANIHQFVMSLPMGYETSVGDRGTQLSGGQKQRIAIARALVRNPHILLLDEATSALDTESEKVVQEALDNAREGRTCIVIAHRLSTIQNADQIVVIHRGRVVERGKHLELLAKEGIYFRLHSIQAGKSSTGE